MSGIYIFVGILAIVIGLINIRNKNLAWQWQKSENSWNGVKSERTADWEAMSTLRGYLAVIIGIVLLFMAWNEIDRTRREEESFKQWYKEFGSSLQREK